MNEWRDGECELDAWRELNLATCGLKNCTEIRCERS
jgi:hypothetical protein